MCNDLNRSFIERLLKMIDENGFLGEEAEAISKQIERDHIDSFKLCYDINRVAQTTKFKFNIRYDGQEVITVCLFIKILDGYQAAILLIKRGFESEARALIRIVLEALIFLKACCDDPDYIKIFIQSDEVERLKILRMARKNPDEALEPLRDYATDSVVSELQEKIKREGISKRIVKDVAIQAGMTKYYDSCYRLFSDDVHASPRCVDRYIEENEDGDLSTLKNGPTADNARFSLEVIAGIMIRALEFMMVFHKIEDKIEMDSFKDRLKNLS